MSKKSDAEIALLKAGQISWPAGLTWPYLPAVPQCTCGTSARCMKHYPADWGTIWVSAQNNGCAGAAPVPQTFVIDTTAAQPWQWPSQTFVGAAAGCAPVQTFMLPA